MGKRETARDRRLAESMLGELTDHAAALDQAPALIEAGLAAEAPAVVLTDIEALLERLRADGMASLFHDDDELRAFYRVMAERILARMLTLTDVTLVKIGQKLETTPLGAQSLRNLTFVLDSLTRQEAAMATAIKQAASSPGPQRASDRSESELRAEIAAGEAQLRALNGPEA